MDEELAVASTATDDLAVLLALNLTRTHARLAPFLDRSLREHRLTAAQFNALLVLRTVGPEGLPLSDLGRRLVVTKANVTGLMDRLERDGLAERVGHRDRRVTLARLTRDGRRVLDDVAPAHARCLGEAMSVLTEDEQTLLIQLLSKLRRSLRERAGASGEA